MEVLGVEAGVVAVVAVLALARVMLSSGCRSHARSCVYVLVFVSCRTGVGILGDEPRPQTDRLIAASTILLGVCSRTEHDTILTSRHGSSL